MAVHIDREGVFLYFDPDWGFYRPLWREDLISILLGGMMDLNYNPTKLGEY